MRLRNSSKMVLSTATARPPGINKDRKLLKVIPMRRELRKMKRKEGVRKADFEEMSEMHKNSLGMIEASSTARPPGEFRNRKFDHVIPIWREMRSSKENEGVKKADFEIMSETLKTHSKWWRRGRVLGHQEESSEAQRWGGGARRERAEMVGATSERWVVVELWCSGVGGHLSQHGFDGNLKFEKIISKAK